RAPRGPRSKRCRGRRNGPNPRRARGEAPARGRCVARRGFRLMTGDWGRGAATVAGVTMGAPLPYPRLTRRQAVAALSGLALAALPRRAAAFGEEGAFNPRVLLTGNARWEGVRTTAPARWSAELMTRTSAPARKEPGTIRADDPLLLAEPFA